MTLIVSWYGIPTPFQTGQRIPNIDIQDYNNPLRYCRLGAYQKPVTNVYYFYTIDEMMMMRR